MEERRRETGRRRGRVNDCRDMLCVLRAHPPSITAALKKALRPPAAPRVWTRISTFGVILENPSSTPHLSVGFISFLWGYVFLYKTATSCEKSCSEFLELCRMPPKNVLIFFFKFQFNLSMRAKQGCHCWVRLFVMYNGMVGTGHQITWNSYSLILCIPGSKQSLSFLRVQQLAVPLLHIEINTLRLLKKLEQL